MSTELRDRLREIQDALGVVDGPEGVERAGDLGAHAEAIERYAAELTAEGEEPGEAAERLTGAAKAVRRAAKAAERYRVNPLTRDFSQGRFALATGQARVRLGGAIDVLDGVPDAAADAS
ncbi:hypothetical protein [Streptomyces corynorhini]|uniref:Uncharacterized protein n=1 Tax=Streptomyces corynorhini TaxID=2282652 RepID=A0A370BKV8_9ACTN|nr:hypothetical protein [Streptomyces corynorhini]RDG39965.1 hypothetical protein DVH02_01255 [Streptomyces corynorhini]